MTDKLKQHIESMRGRDMTWNDVLRINRLSKQHPCTPCPNFTNATCCHSTTQNDFEAMDAKHCSPLCKQSGATIPNFVCALLVLVGLLICMAINAQVGAV